MFFCILGIKLVVRNSTLGFLSSSWSVGYRDGEEDWWKIICTCIWWSVRKERNFRYFEGTSNSIQKIWMHVLVCSFFGVNKYVRQIGDLVDLNWQYIRLYVLGQVFFVVLGKNKIWTIVETHRTLPLLHLSSKSLCSYHILESEYDGLGDH